MGLVFANSLWVVGCGQLVEPTSRPVDQSSKKVDQGSWKEPGGTCGEQGLPTQNPLGEAARKLLIPGSSSPRPLLHRVELPGFFLQQVSPFG